MPVEAFQGKFDPSSDIWSAGVILYVILSGKMPFYGESQFDIFLKIFKGIIVFDEWEWRNVSQEAKELIKQILVKPYLRLTTLQILSHPWLKQRGKQSQKEKEEGTTTKTLTKSD